MKKLFVFKLNGKIYKEKAISITKDAEILFEGAVDEHIPQEMKDLLNNEKNMKDKEESTTLLYQEMVKDVYDEMNNVFGTRNDVSASAFAATYEAMIKRPDNYVGEDLGFVDTAAVIQYANAKLAASDAYAVFRMKRIAQFEAEKAAIQNA